MLRVLGMAIVCAMMSGFVTQAHAAASDQRASAFVLCKNKKSVRTIRVMPDAASQENCTITYSKGSTEEIVGQNRSITTCKSILKNIQANLENSQWSCRNVSAALVTTSSEVTR